MRLLGMLRVGKVLRWKVLVGFNYGD